MQTVFKLSQTGPMNPMNPMEVTKANGNSKPFKTI